MQNPRRCHNTKVIASTHAQMHPRNIILARCFVLATTPSAFRRWAWSRVRVRSYDLSSRACHVKHHAQLLSFRAKFFDNSNLLVRFC